MHSHYCDGKGPVSEYVDRAAELQMPSVGMSSHAPLPFPSSWCMKPDRFEHYCQTLQLFKASASIQLYSGLEVDYIPDVISPSDFSKSLDYTIGSIHFVDQLPDGTHWEIDGLHTLFLEGYEKIFRKDIRAVMERYFELTREMIHKACPTIIGHLDKIKIQNSGNCFFDEKDNWYQQAIKRTIDVIADSGAIIEVNTRGIYQRKSIETYPGARALEYIHARNIPVTLSSDAHHPDDLANQFQETATMLHAIGFRELSVLHDGQWQSYPFDEHGIIIR